VQILCMYIHDSTTTQLWKCRLKVRKMETDPQPSKLLPHGKYCYDLQILLIASEWDAEKRGISSFNMDLACMLCKQGHSVYCAVLNATFEQALHAQKCGVTLLTPKPVDGDLQELRVSRLIARLQIAPQKTAQMMQKWDVPRVLLILGHAHITGKIAILKKRELLRKYPNKDIACGIVNHILPLKVDPLWEGEGLVACTDVKMEEVVGFAKQCDLVFSVGPAMYKQYETFYHGLKVKHYRLDPPLQKDALEYRHVTTSPPTGGCVLMFGRTDRVMSSKCMYIISRVIGKYSKNCDQMGLNVPRFVVRGAATGETNSVKEHLKESSGFRDMINVEVHELGSPAEILEDLRMSTVCVMPSRMEPFGSVGLLALTTGTPVLVTKGSGLAQLMKELKLKDVKRASDAYHDFVVQSPSSERLADSHVDDWVKQLGKILNNPIRPYDTASDIRAYVVSEYSASVIGQWHHAIHCLARERGYYVPQVILLMLYSFLCESTLCLSIGCYDLSVFCIYCEVLRCLFYLFGFTLVFQQVHECVTMKTIS